MLTVGVLLSSIFFIGKINLFISLKIQSYILMILMGPPFAGFLVLPNAIIADIIDYDEKITGLRREGMYYGIQALVIKIGISLATGVAGIIMETFGKDIGRDLGVRLLGPVAAVFIFIALFVFKFYNLGEEDETKRNL
jgi:GPH family glycoside/pentoside/hexuronide:cation symporter